MATYKDLATSLLGRRAITEYAFPGASTAKVGVKALADAEMDTVRRQAAAFCEEKHVNLVIDPEFMDRAMMRHTIAAACFDAETGKKFFDSQEQVAELDGSVVLQLYQLYVTHQESLDPLLYKSEQEVDELIDALGKASSPLAALSLLDANTLRRYALSMAWKLREMRQPRK